MAGGTTVDLRGGWDKVWNTISASFGGFMMLMTILGVVLIVFALFKYFWDKRRGGSPNAGALGWAIALGALLSGPGLIIPVLLSGFDIIANAVAKIFSDNIK